MEYSFSEGTKDVSNNIVTADPGPDVFFFVPAQGEISRSFSKYRNYDVFLSHSKRDEIVILQLYDQLVKQGLSVYVDWINDPLLNRSQVTPATANLLFWP